MVKEMHYQENTLFDLTPRSGGSRSDMGGITLESNALNYGKCSKISNTLKLRTPKIIAEDNF